MKSKVHFSSITNEWATPQQLFNELDEEFHFTLDPCATPETAKCKKFYTKEDDGLSKMWDGERVFCNPPYGSEIKHWVRHCAIEATRGTLIVLLVPARTDTAYFHDHIYNNNHARIRFLRGRIKFTNKGESSNPAPFPSMLVIFN